MALVSLFFNSPQRAKLGQMELDASISETHEASASLSQFEIEDGSQITDNVTLSSIKLTIEGVISKSPLNASALIGSLGTALGGAVGAAQVGGMSKLAGGAANVITGSIGGLVAGALDADGAPKSRNPNDVFEYLLELRNKRTPFDVVTALKLYENMILTGLNVPRNAQTVGQLRFTATLEQVRYVSAMGVDISAFNSLSTVNATPATKLGKQGASAASAKTTNDASIAYQTLIGG